jgi:hypothetical protein
MLDEACACSADDFDMENPPSSSRARAGGDTSTVPTGGTYATVRRWSSEISWSSRGLAPNPHCHPAASHCPGVRTPNFVLRSVLPVDSSTPIDSSPPIATDSLSRAVT